VAQGKKYLPEIKEKAIAMLAVCDNINEIARQLGLPASTVRTWQQQLKNGDTPEAEDFAKLRAKKKQEFVEAAWKNIELATKVLTKRLSRALDEEEKVDSLLIDEVEELNKEERKTLLRKVAALKVEDISKLSITLGTLYDKQALANEEPTSEIRIKGFEDYQC